MASDNLPTVDWQDGQNAARVKFQVMHEEPVVLMMPSGMDWSVDGSEFGCTADPDSGMQRNCEGSGLLRKLAELNDMPRLKDIADACEYSSSRIDTDPSCARIIFHD
ncbi:MULTISPECIES: hypothetical protein [unclassified Thioalkalivibrio]|uniref:hypothetical protein n=1 Tax=unclassified Thioalkalivibrio TaxID=2621013 RepID=UPI00037DAB54|nr:MULTISPECIES: hypothetical protein [unclassified Thioalkalivibrio]